MPLWLVIAFAFPAMSFASKGGIKQEKITQVQQEKIHEIAKKIRAYKKWQILNVKPKRVKNSATKRRQVYRFKLLGKNGDVKIVTIDPDDVDLDQQFK